MRSKLHNFVPAFLKSRKRLPGLEGSQTRKLRFPGLSAARKNVCTVCMHVRLDKSSSSSCLVIRAALLADTCFAWAAGLKTAV